MENSLSWPDRDFLNTGMFSNTGTSAVSLMTSVQSWTPRLVYLLEQNLIFQSTGKGPQRPVRYQFACFLLRYGS